MVLREIKESDLLAIFEHERDLEACRMAAYPVRDLEGIMRHWREKILGDPNTKKMAIVINDEVVGNIVSWENNGKRLVGYWIGKDYWGRGIAAMALREFMVDVEKTRPLFAYVATLNSRSFRVLEKCGFERVGDATIGPGGVEEVLFQIH
jgi:RimJ/RimL family protein N-acetyltransferase